MNTNSEETFLDWIERLEKESTEDHRAESYEIMLKVAGSIANEMHRQNLSQSKFAKKLGVSEGWVSRLLNAPPNMSVGKIVEACMALKMKVDINFIPTWSKENEIPLDINEANYEIGKIENNQAIYKIKNVDSDELPNIRSGMLKLISIQKTPIYGKDYSDSKLPTDSKDVPSLTNSAFLRQA